MLRESAKHLSLMAACAAALLFSSSASRPAGEAMAYQGIPQKGELTTREAVEHFNDAFNRHDADALALLLTEDTVFEDTSPAPDGQRIEGKTAVVAFWRGWFARNSDAKFETEEMIVSGGRAVGVSQDAQRTTLAPAWSGSVHRPRGESSGETRLCERVSGSGERRLFLSANQPS